MKVIIVLASFVAVASAGHLYGAGPIDAQGTSTQFRSEDDYGNFQFGYDESHATGGSSRREEETNGVRRGSYSVSDADGRRRVVNFIADASGFHADVQTNEPGVEAKDPADVIINRNEQQVVAAPAPVLAAPAPVFSAPIKSFVAQAPIVQAPIAQAPIAQAQIFSAPIRRYAAPAPIAQAPIFSAPIKSYAAPAPVAQTQIFSAPIKSYAAPAPIAQAPLLAAPVRSWAPAQIAAPLPAPTFAAEAQVIEAPTPRAFSYSFGSTHVAPAPIAAAASAYAPRAYAAPAPLEPIFQQRQLNY